MKKILKISIISMMIIAYSSCDTEYLDPFATLEPEVVSSTDNLIKLINGIQQRWSTDRNGGIYNITHISGLNTDELRLLNPGNQGENEILLGGDNVDGSNSLLNNLWNNAMLVRKEATTVYDGSEGATDDAGVISSLKAYALFYRALAHGELVMYFESLPLEIIDNSPFNSRSEVLQNAISDLSEAKSFIDAGLSSEVTSEVFKSVDLKNSVDALLARFYLMAGNNDAAIAAANDVNLSVKSTWQYDAGIPNPLAFWFGSDNVAQAKDLTFGLPDDLLPDENDQRIPFYITADDFNVPIPNYQVVGFWVSNLDEIPVYLPGEIMLIKAEAFARKDQLIEAVNQLNVVLTKTSVDDVYGLGAALPAYSGEMTREAILDEIYKNRRIELYLTGLSLEDTRRFGRPGATSGDAERNRDYYPYPNAERDNNTSTPSNPST